jgi:alpha-beta hydrolase superfamily lysophospholipase
MMPERPVVCFAKPGGGYSRRYYTESLPGPAEGSQAEWHAARGWIFISVDHLGVGDSSTHHDPLSLTYTPVVSANQAAEQEVLRRLREGTVSEGFPRVEEPVILGIGQSMGGCLTVVQQGRHHCYDGIAVLGYSVFRVTRPTGPGIAPAPETWVPRDLDPALALRAIHGDGEVRSPGRSSSGEWEGSIGQQMAWGFHYDDVDDDVVKTDLFNFPARDTERAPWASPSVPAGVALWCAAPGAVASEASAVRSPVLIAMAERDVVADPAGESRAYLSSTSIDLFICPRMGHMHNFASTRELLWRRIDAWASWVRAQKDA